MVHREENIYNSMNSKLRKEVTYKYEDKDKDETEGNQRLEKEDDNNR